MESGAWGAKNTGLLRVMTKAVEFPTAVASGTKSKSRQSAPRILAGERAVERTVERSNGDRIGEPGI
jgi:hypothetical protein